MLTDLFWSVIKNKGLAQINEKVPSCQGVRALNEWSGLLPSAVSRLLSAVSGLLFAVCRQPNLCQGL